MTEQRTRAAGASSWTAATLLAFAGSFFLYWRSMAPTVYNLDSAEFTTAVATGGLVHATGYPLYLMIGRLWSFLPIGDMGYRMNLLSVFCAASTIALLIHILRRLAVSPLIALCAAGFLASTRFFWAMALIAEVYTLHTMLLCGIVLLLLRWADRPSPLRLTLASGALGLAAGNHASIILLVPGFVFFVVATRTRSARSIRALAAAAAGLLCGLSVYLYLPWLYAQDPVFNYLVVINSLGETVPIDLTSLKGFLWLVSAQPFAELFFARGGGSLLAELGKLALELWRSSFIIAFGPALLGIWIAFDKSRALGGLLVLSFATNATFFLSYGALDRETMYLPLYVIWSIWIGLGGQYIVSMAYSRAGWISATCLAAVLAGTVAFSIAWCFPLVDLSDDWSSRELAEALLDDLESDALFVGSWHNVPVVHYLQFVEGKRPDVLAVNRFHIGEVELSILIKSELDHRPVYTDYEYEAEHGAIRSQLRGSVHRIERSAPD
jgi:hypothetical protein